MREATIDMIGHEVVRGVDVVTGTPRRFGMGFGLNDPDAPLSPSERAFYWGGWGGSIAIVDLDRRVSIAYVMNKMANTTVGDTRRCGHHPVCVQFARG